MFGVVSDNVKAMCLEMIDILAANVERLLMEMLSDNETLVPTRC
jgi:hypothetical protein